MDESTSEEKGTQNLWMYIFTALTQEQREDTKSLATFVEVWEKSLKLHKESPRRRAFLRKMTHHSYLNHYPVIDTVI